MNRLNKAVLLLLALATSIAACTKIETTSLGSDLVPVVDNINTFETIIEVNASNLIPGDSTRIFAGDAHPVGAIANDPLFGASRATLFFEAKPNAFPYAIPRADSALVLDSAVMVLDYIGTYGDSLSTVNFRLFESAQAVNRDTAALPYYTFNPPLTPGSFLGQKSMRANQYRDTVQIRRKDSVYRKVTNQLRIPIDQNFALRLFRSDSAAGGAFRSDSLFKANFNGFAVQADASAQALHYFLLAGNNTGIELYYRAYNKLTKKEDTLETTLRFTGLSGHAVKFERNRNGSEVANSLTGDPVKGAERLYIQTAPGTVALVKIPGIDTLTNRIIHRAELRAMEAEPNDAVFSQLTPPPVLYMDVADTNNTYRGIPYDLTPFSNYFCFPGLPIEYAYFGGNTRYEIVNGQRLAVYRFNISRYLQAIVTRKEKRVDFRISAPYYMQYDNCVNTSPLVPSNFFLLRNPNNSIANLPGNGRIRLAGSNHPDPKKKMVLRIIWSKI